MDGAGRGVELDLDAVAAMASSRDRAAATPSTRPRESLRSAQGFNKNVTAYVTKGREALAKVPGGDFTLVHHNAYKANELGECFERNAEGMLKNMARSRRPVVWRRLHAIDATRVHQTRS